METLFALGRHTLAGLRALLVLTLLVGLAYPAGRHRRRPDRLRLAGVRLARHRRRKPHDVVRRRRRLGTDRPGLRRPEWFHPRPSAAGDGWDPLATAGSNLGPQNADLVATIQERRASVAAEEGIDPADVPADALTASASGLDPHVSPAYAALQVPRVARENGLSEQQVSDLVEEHTDGRTLGVLGEARVDVLALNSAVAALRD